MVSIGASRSAWPPLGRVAAIVAALAFAALLAPAAIAGPGGGAAGGPSFKPFDYIGQEKKLSQPTFSQTARTELTVEMPDGEELYVEVVRPDPDEHGDGPWPVIMEVSPYHGTVADRDGTRIFPDPEDDEGNQLGLTGYFAPRGYAVVMVDLRGTGRSTGCLDHLGQNDAQDLNEIIEWAADQEWSNGRVGLTGHSYVGSTPSVAAAQNPEGLVTIAPSAGLAGFYDHQFQKGVPWLLQWAGPMFAYPTLSTDRDLPPGATNPVSGASTGDNFENAPNSQFGCGWQSSSLTAGSGQVTGQYEAWHAERDWREGAAEAEIPIFMIHGVHDNAARIPAAEWFFANRFSRPGDKVWIGQWDHGSTNGRCGNVDGQRELHPTCRFDQFKYALHAWFDRHLMQRQNVRTGPAVEAFLNGPDPVDVTTVVDPESLGGQVYATNGWKRPAATASLFPDATTPGPGDSDGTLSFEPPAEDGSATFGTTAEIVIGAVGRGSLTFTSEPVAEDTLFLGLPELQLNASLSTGQIMHLTTTLFREQVTTDEEGEEVVRREPLDFCAIQPQLRDGIDTVTPVVPGEEMALDPQCFTIANWVPAGQRLSLEISTKTPHHASFGSTDRNITVFTGPEATRYTLPVVPRFKLFDDVPLRESHPDPVPLGPAQPGIEGEVITLAPGAGVIVEPVTAASFEFDSEEGYDNAAFEAVATPLTPADIDLYLQRQTPDGGWADIAAAETGDLSQEVLTAGRLNQGRYRLVVHNWIGGPQEVHLKLTFFNGDGEPGEGTEDSGSEGTAQVVTGESYGLIQP